MSLLKVSPADLANFQAELATLNSERDQRGLIKKFLLASGPRLTQTTWHWFFCDSTSVVDEALLCLRAIVDAQLSQHRVKYMVIEFLQSGGLE